MPPDLDLARRARSLYPLFVFVAALAVGNVFGLEVALLIVAGGVLVGAIWMMWSSLQGLAGEAPLTLDEAVSLGAPSVEEEQKRSVLRALKDLEYEREVGKLSDEDYESLALHYRREAKRLLQVVDADLSAERERGEQLVRQRLAASQSGGEPRDQGDRDQDGDDGGDSDETSSARAADEHETAEDDGTDSAASDEAISPPVPTSDPAR